jgi:RNA polymerase sigma-70 factor (ECF subfamily)
LRDLFDFDMLSRQGLIAGASLQIFLPGITAPALLVGWPEFAPGVASSVERNGTVPGARRLSAREALCVMPHKSSLQRLDEESIEPDISPDAQSCPVQADLGQIYRDEAPRLARYFRRRLREPEEPHDLVQESFARLAGFMARQPLISPGPYLQRIARNLLFERARQRRRKMAAFHVPIGEGAHPTIAPDQAHRIEARDVMRLYRKALDELPDRTREIFLLHRVEDLTYKAIGARLGVSIPTVQYHVARALAHIDAALEQE